MAKKIVLACDNCAEDIPEGQHVAVRLTYVARSRVADFCESCADKLPGRAVGKRGRKRKDPLAA